MTLHLSTCVCVCFKLFFVGTLFWFLTLGGLVEKGNYLCFISKKKGFEW